MARYAMRKPTFQIDAALMARIMDEKLTEAIKVRYDALNEGVQDSLFSLVEDAIFDIFQQKKGDSLLMRNIHHQIKSEMFMDALRRRVAGRKSLITQMTAHVKRQKIRFKKNTAWDEGPVNGT